MCYLNLRGFIENERKKMYLSFDVNNGWKNIDEERKKQQEEKRKRDMVKLDPDELTSISIMRNNEKIAQEEIKLATQYIEDAVAKRQTTIVFKIYGSDVEGWWFKSLRKYSVSYLLQQHFQLQGLKCKLIYDDSWCLRISW